MSSDELSVLETEYFQETSIQESTVGTNRDQTWSDYAGGETYENRISRTREYRRKILAAIYFDINHVSILRRFFKTRRGAGAAHHGIVRYKAECANTANFIDHVVAQSAVAHGFEPFDLDCEIETQIQRSKDPRSSALVTQLGWKLLAICAHSEGFRRAFKEMDRTQWSMLLGEISQNRRSLEVFARSRRLEWRGPLLHHRTRSIYETLVRTDIDLAATGHPHHLVRMRDGRVACPTYEDKLQEHIEQSIFRSSDWPLGRRDPTMRVPADGECDLCFSKNICDCTVPSLVGDLVELVEYRGKGVGVRALANFKSNDILGVYLGELRPRDYKSDPIYSLLQQPKIKFRGREAIISAKRVISRHQNTRLTYDGLDAKSNSLARGLESVGVRKGDRVAVMLGNSIEYAIATYGLFKLGAILVPLNPSFNVNQVASALSHLSASHLIISAEANLPRRDPRNNIPLLRHLVPDLESSKIESALVPSLKQVIMVDNSSGRVDLSTYKSLTPYPSVISELASDSRPLDPRDLSPHDIVNIQFTSGTTSMPKAACLSHRSILNNGAQIGDRMRLTPNDVVCCPPPLFHCFGCILGYMATATHGSAIVFPAESFNALASLKAVQEEKCTALYGVPTMFIEELSLLEKGEVADEGFQYLRTGIAAGSSVPAELMRKLHKTLNLTELTICYGMTETSPVSAMTTTDDPMEKRISSVGRLMPHVEAKVVNPADRSEILPVDTKGELVVSGYLVMKEYWDAPDRTAEVLVADQNGKVWMHTGDEATISPDGYVTITGRIKDLIIRGGENIHPLEIENSLLANPRILDVSVVGVPDERYGEVVGAFVVPKDQGDGAITTDEIKQWVREKLSNHLVPKYVFYLPNSTALPKTASGKIQKFKLKEMAIQLLKEENSKGGEELSENGKATSTGPA
ncbi:AMP-binding enzyme, putative [Paecilomyces variotii No. 5]|uniref:AMP-binding enzyme, putative n=1 Tax=Byssochlamys spectabilis (strain No. 5 / NBRC 109023) TaxID=1356009 RepID=V5I3D9_BYSSN|nr:AMP-binding enzyme, putative [Paecilomyces variotii No. 5]